MPPRRVIIFEIANWKVQIENFIFPIFIFQLFHTFFDVWRLCLHGELLYLKLQIGKCKLKILFFQFSFFNYSHVLRRVAPVPP